MVVHVHIIVVDHVHDTCQLHYILCSHKISFVTQLNSLGQGRGSPLSPCGGGVSYGVSHDAQLHGASINDDCSRCLVRILPRIHSEKKNKFNIKSLQNLSKTVKDFSFRIFLCENYTLYNLYLIYMNFSVWFFHCTNSAFNFYNIVSKFGSLNFPFFFDNFCILIYLSYRLKPVTNKPKLRSSI